MNTVKFHQQADILFNKIEERLDNYIDEFDTDIDYERNGNVITITFEKQSKIIINTQEPLSQIWMATRKQGYHFEYVNDEWICNRTQYSFDQLFDESVKEQIDF